MDVFSKQKRSEIMSKIRSQNTGIERTVFRALRRRGIYFQKHYRRAPGSPDIALPRKKKAVFLDGDFWHGYRFGQKEPSSAYWADKIAGNIKRDRRNRRQLKQSGWTVLRVWEHDIKRKPDQSIEKIIAFLIED